MIWREFNMKSAMIVAALCAAFCVSTPAVQAKGMSDTDLFCKFFPLASKCAPAKPAATPAHHMSKPMAKPMLAMAKPAAKPMTKMSIKMWHCEKRTDGKPYLLSCAWK